MTALARLSLRYRSVTIMVVGLLIVTGSLAVGSLNQELFPSFDIPNLVVSASQPGAGPEAIVEGVTKPIENAVRSTPGIKHVDSTTLEGLTFVAAQYDYGTDMAERERQLKEKVDAITFPEGAAEPKIQRISIDSFPIYSLAVSGPDAAVVEHYADTVLQPELAAVDGIGSVDQSGGSARTLTVTLDPHKLAQANASAADVTAALRTANISMPAGGISGGTTQVPVQVQAAVTTLDQLRALPIGPRATLPAQITADATGPVRPATIGDVATVARSETGAGTTISRTDGQPSIGLDVIKDQSANTVISVRRIKTVLEENPPPDGVRITEVTNQAPQIEESVSGLARDAVLGALFAIALILLFLRSFRSTLVAGVSIPLSLLVAFLFMHADGISLNVLTLGALSVAAGRVIDDAIVVLENIYRLLESGMERSEAVLLGTSQMVPAITASTLTTVAVFLPLAFVGGLVGTMFLGFALTITFSLLASLLVAVTVVPVLADLFLRAKARQEPAPDPTTEAAAPAEAERVENGDGRIRAAYGRRLTWALSHRPATIALAFLLLAASMAAASQLKSNLFPAGEIEALSVTLNAPAGTNLTGTTDRVKTLEDSLRGLPGVERFTSVIGTSDSALAAFSGAGSGSSSARVTVDLRDDTDPDPLIQRIKMLIPQADLTGAVTKVDSGYSNDKLAVSVTGDNFEEVSAGAAQVKLALAKIKGLEDLRDNIAAETLRVTVQVDPARAGARGLNPVAVGGVVRAALTPTPAGRVVVDDVERQLIVAMEPSAVADYGQLAALPVSPGVTLGTVADVSTGQTPTIVTRHDERRSAEVSGIIVSDNSGVVNRDVTKALDDLPLPAGVETSLGGEAESQKESFAALGLAMLLAVFLVYVTMVVAFGSLLTPFVILFSLPMAAIGAFPALLITGREMGMPAMLGLLMLIGIVVTNAIVLLEFAERLMDEGRPIREALIEAGQTRLRPIVMTAAATICALFPLALGLSEGALLSASLATVVIGGLLSSTLLTLLVIPVVYLTADRIRAKVTGRGKTAAGAEADDEPVVLAPSRFAPPAAAPAPEWSPPVPEPVTNGHQSPPVEVPQLVANGHHTPAEIPELIFVSGPTNGHQPRVRPYELVLPPEPELALQPPGSVPVP